MGSGKEHRFTKGGVRELAGEDTHLAMTFGKYQDTNRTKAPFPPLEPSVSLHSGVRGCMCKPNTDPGCSKTRAASFHMLATSQVQVELSTTY